MTHAITLKKTLDGLLKWVTNNQNNVLIPDTEKFLYRIFNGSESDGFDYLEQAKSLVLRTSKNPRKLETRLQFDPDRASIPTIHISLAADAVGKENAIGLGASQDIFNNTYDNSFSIVYRRSFIANYDLIITSINPNEVDLIYELIMHLFIAAADTLTETFDTFTYSGRTVIMNNELSPDRIFSRNISLSVDFNRRTPSIGYSVNLINNLSFEGSVVSLTVKVLDSLNNPIENVDVKVGSFSTNTDINGIAKFSLINNTYKYIISAFGYVTQKGNVIIKDYPKELNIVLLNV